MRVRVASSSSLRDARERSGLLPSAETEEAGSGGGGGSGGGSGGAVGDGTEAEAAGLAAARRRITVCRGSSPAAGLATRRAAQQAARAPRWRASAPASVACGCPPVGARRPARIRRACASAISAKRASTRSATVFCNGGGQSMLSAERHERSSASYGAPPASASAARFDAPVSGGASTTDARSSDGDM